MNNQTHTSLFAARAENAALKAENANTARKLSTTDDFLLRILASGNNAEANSRNALYHATETTLKNAMNTSPFEAATHCQTSLFGHSAVQEEAASYQHAAPAA